MTDKPNVKLTMVSVQHNGRRVTLFVPTEIDEDLKARVSEVDYQKALDLCRVERGDTIST